MVIYELSGCIFSNFVAYMDDIYENIEKCNQDKEHKILIKFDNMIVDQLSKKRLNPILTELFIRGRKPNISLVCIIQAYFAVRRNIRLDSTHNCIMKIRGKQIFRHLIIYLVLTMKTL